MSTASNSRVASKRWLIWLPLLGIAFWLAVFGNQTNETTLVAPSVRNDTLDRMGTVAASLTDERTRHIDQSQTIRSITPRTALIGVANSRHLRTDLFAQRSWQSVLPPAKATPASTEPELPPLPFAYTGKKMEDGHWEVYLVRANEVFVVREGDQLTSSYRVEKLAPPILNLRYLPMDQLQTLAIGDPD